MTKEKYYGNSLSTYISKEKLRELCQKAKESGEDSVKIADIEAIFGWDE